VAVNNGGKWRPQAETAVTTVAAVAQAEAVVAVEAEVNSGGGNNDGNGNDGKKDDEILQPEPNIPGAGGSPVDLFRVL